MHSPRHDWTRSELDELYALPFNDLLFKAHQIHRKNFDPNQIQASSLLSIKTGSCPEDCKYCPQSAHYNTGLTKQDLLEVKEVLAKAEQAKNTGANRFCMGAAWRKPNNKDFQKVLAMVEGVKKLGLETCMTLGQLNTEQAQALAQAGLDYYNHNLDTSPEYYEQIISTRNFASRLATLDVVRAAGMKVCAGGILGMGEVHEDRLGLIQALANLMPQPESVPLNLLVKVAGTPLEQAEDLDPLEFIRWIAIARCVLPQSWLRLSAGRESLSSSNQALAFFAGANSIFYGEKLLTTANPAATQDEQLFAQLGLSLVPSCAVQKPENPWFYDAAAPKKAVAELD